MFNDGRAKKVLIITILLVLTLGTIATAANNITVKQLTATHGRIKFKVDGKDVTNQIESKYNSPAFTVKEYNSRSYVPVRAIAELMGLKIEYDDSTHTAEIIDPKAKQYKEELAKKDKKIAELEKEIKKLKGDVVEEGDLDALEKKLNKEYGTYGDGFDYVDFDIKLKKGTKRIDVTLTMDLKDYRERNTWNKIYNKYRKDLAKDITDTIASEFKNVDIYGSVYDEDNRKYVMEFNKKQGKSLVYSGGSGGSYSDYDYIDDIVYDEFDYNYMDAYLDHISSSGRNVYLDIDIDYRDKGEWRGLSQGKKLDILDRISDEVFYEYSDCDRVLIDIYIDGKLENEYTIDYDSRRGSLK